MALETSRPPAAPDPVAARLATLGMSTAVAEVFRGALAGPGGLVLIAGPAGSGRATTVAAALALRSDAVSIGAIDDAHKASQAVEAASGGRPVVATLAEPSAAGAVARLLDLRIEPYLIASTLRAAFAQRLVRRLCPHCRVPSQATSGQAALLGFDAGLVSFEPGGCAACAGTGYAGRIGLFEAVRIDVGLGRLISQGCDLAVIASHAYRDRPDVAGAARAMVRDGIIAAADALSLSRGAGYSQ